MYMCEVNYLSTTYDLYTVRGSVRENLTNTKSLLFSVILWNTFPDTNVFLLYGVERVLLDDSKN